MRHKIHREKRKIERKLPIGTDNTEEMAAYKHPKQGAKDTAPVI